MNKKETALFVCKVLEEIYPEAVCSLNYSKPYELMFAARLSAQCTDARVNVVTETLFKKYPTLEAFAEADISELEKDVKPCGFYRMKAESLKAIARRLIDNFDGRIPETMDELLTLPGIGRKTANLIMGDIWGKPAIVTDTHFIRITGRLGLTENTQPAKVEKDLAELIPPEKSSDFCHRTVQFGRDTCRARAPKCGECRLSEVCTYNYKTKEAK